MAHLAFLVQLILDDSEHLDQATKLRALFRQWTARFGDFDWFVLEASEIAKSLGVSSRILALATVQWLAESDLAPARDMGSANWIELEQLIGVSPLQTKTEIESMFKASDKCLNDRTLDPLECVEGILVLNKQLGVALTRTLNQIKASRGRQKKLFYEMDKIQLRVFYHSSLRGRNLDSPQIREIIGDATAMFNLSVKEEKKAAQKWLYDCSRQVTHLFDQVEKDLEQ